MSEFFKINFNGDTLTVDFGDPAENDQVVKYTSDRLKALYDEKAYTGGPLLKITGRCSLPNAFILCHAVGHLYGTVAVFDPKLSKYVVVINHGGAHQIGDLID